VATYTPSRCRRPAVGHHTGNAGLQAFIGSAGASGRLDHHGVGVLVVEALVQPSAHRAMILETGRLLDACQETRRQITERGLPRIPTVLLAATHRANNSEKMRSGNLFKWLLDRMPGAEMRELPETGHFIPPEAPDSVIQAVRDLLARIAPGRSREN